jgi:LacI family transcriptional regulator
LSSLKNKKIAIIGYDLIEKNLNFLNQGLIHFLIHQNQKKQAYLGVSTLVEHFLFQKRNPRNYFTPNRYYKY